MDPVRSERLKSILLRAVKLSGEERNALLASECAGDAELRARVEEMLLHSDATEPMEAPAVTARPGYAPTLANGRLVAGRFRVTKFLGKGGMGEVYQATDQELGGELALKIILPGLVHDESLLARFRREVHLARQVTHPNVCRIFDVGRDEVDGEELLFLTMELIEGETLSAQLKREKKLAPEEALPLLEQMARGLAALHEKNIVHRDLKPGNVMIVRGSGSAARAVIGDFGLARAVLEESAEEGLSRSGAVLGTPGYMAPEQMTGIAVSAATDIYAFGIVAHEMVTGKRTVTKSGELPAAWEQTILRCVEHNPQDRPQTVEEVVAGLAGRKEDAVERPGRRLWWLGGAAAVLSVGLAGWIWMGPGGAGEERAGGGGNAAYLQATDLLDHAYRQGATQKAVELLEPLAAKPDAKALIHAALGRAYYRRYRETTEPSWLEKARVAGERAGEMDGQLAMARVLLGRVYTQSGKSDLAMQELQTALKLDSRNADAYLALAELFEKQGRTNEIEPNLQKAVDLAPGSWTAHANFGLYLRNAKRFEEARQEFLRLLEVTPDNASAHSYLGRLYLDQERFAEARKAYQDELRLAPSFRVYSNLGVVLQLEGRYEEAARMFEKAIELNPKSFRSWGNLGSALTWSGADKAKAREAHQKAIALTDEARKAAPNDVTVLAAMGSYYAALGDEKRSVPLLRQAVALDPESPAIAFQVGEAYESLHRRDEALRWIRVALQKGFSPEYIKRNPELAQLRKDPRFSWTTR